MHASSDVADLSAHPLMLIIAKALQFVDSNPVTRQTQIVETIRSDIHSVSFSTFDILLERRFSLSILFLNENNVLF